MRKNASSFQHTPALVENFQGVIIRKTLYYVVRIYTRPSVVLEGKWKTCINASISFSGKKEICIQKFGELSLAATELQILLALCGVAVGHPQPARHRSEFDPHGVQRLHEMRFDAFSRMENHERIFDPIPFPLPPRASRKVVKVDRSSGRFTSRP